MFNGQEPICPPQGPVTKTSNQSLTVLALLATFQSRELHSGDAAATASVQEGDATVRLDQHHSLPDSCVCACLAPTLLPGWMCWLRA